MIPVLEAQGLRKVYTGGDGMFQVERERVGV